MTGLINLIVDNFPKLIILPVIAIVMVGVTIFTYISNKDRKVAKYIPAIFMGIVGLAIGIMSIFIFTSSQGLNIAWIAVFLGTSAIIGILTAAIIDLFNALKYDYKDFENDSGKRKK